MDCGYNLCSNEETKGFDLHGGKTWIYPTNLPIRDYQFKIVEKALLQNTMVTLPTGLGKTFIAAVVMYNYFRWYPNGKIIFMAPTRPLVKQQIEACYNIVAIPKDMTAELTGSTTKSNRNDIWTQKRVFFITPQVLQNDLDRILKLAKEIKCLVFDEAHRARGNYAYCEVIKQILPFNKYFRVLALSATPGSNISDVITVCNSLLISHLEARNEESQDVAQYICKRTVETVVVRFDGKLKQVYDNYLKILDRYVRILVHHRIVQGNCANLSKGRFFYILEDFKKANSMNRIPAYGEIIKNLNICIILYHAFQLLVQHGLRGFMKYFDDNSDKNLIRSNSDITNLVEDVRCYLGHIPNVDKLPDGSLPEVPSDTKFGHPKFYRLAEILLGHFKNLGQNSKAIVFCEYKESVVEAYTILLMNKDLIKPKIFVGQGSITQKQQIAVLDSFRKGTCNTLVSTSVGEEGLDVGEVDLVVCFDVSNKSTVRMIQRMGRTGRQRQGKVIILVTEGKEQESLRDVLAHKQNLISQLMNSRELKQELKKQPNIRMVPPEIEPTCMKSIIAIEKEKKKQTNSNLISMFNNMMNSEQIKFKNRIPDVGNFVSLGNKLCSNDCTLTFCRTKNKSTITPSDDTNILRYLVEYAEAKRFNLPISPVKKINLNVVQKKQTDIRSMFKQQATQSSELGTLTPLSQTDENVESLLKEITNYFLIGNQNECKTCKHLFACDVHVFPKLGDFDFSNYKPPNVDNLDTFSLHGSNAEEFDENDDMFEDLDFSVLTNSKYKEEMDNSIIGRTSSDESFPVIQKLEKTNVANTSFIKENITNAKLNLTRMRESSKNVDRQSTHFNVNGTINIEKQAHFNVNEYTSNLENDSNIFPDDEEIESNCFNNTLHTNIFQDDEENKNECFNETLRNDLFSGKEETEEQCFNKISRNESFPDNDDDTFNLSSEKSVQNSRNFGDASQDISSDNDFEDFTISEMKFIFESTLEFFKLKSLEDLFIDKYDPDATIICSPNTLQMLDLESPIIGSIENRTVNNHMAKKRLYSDLSPGCERVAKVVKNVPILNSSSSRQTLTIESPEIIEVLDSSDTSTNLSTCSKSNGSTSPILNKSLKPKELVERLQNISPDLFDSPERVIPNPVIRTPKSTIKKLSQKLSERKKKEVGSKNVLKEIGLDDFCDESIADFFRPLSTKEETKSKSKRQEKLDESLFQYSFDSEEDFEDIHVKSPARKVSHRKKMTPNNRTSFSSTSSESPVYAKRKRINDKLIDDEADVSTDFECSEDEDEHCMDQLDSSFVNDESVIESTSMHAHYLKTTKCSTNTGKFKIPKRPNKYDPSIYSQSDSHGDDSYVNDSFCVNESSIEYTQSLSEVEVAEKNYKTKKKNKRKRIIVSSDDSD